MLARSFPYSVTYDELKGEAYIHSGDISIPKKDAAMVVRVADGVQAVAGGPSFMTELKSEVRVPGMYTFFRVSSLEPTLVRNERYEPEQVLVLAMTAGVLESEIRGKLSVYALPRRMPAGPGRRAVRHYGWHDVKMIGPEVLAASEKLELEALPTEHEYSTLHSFKFEAEPGRPLYVRLEKGVRSYGDYILSETYDRIVRVPQFPRELNIMSDGAVLSLGGEKKLSVVSRGIGAIRFELARVLPGQVNHLVSQAGGQLRNPRFRNWYFNEQNISESFAEVRVLKDADPRRSQYSALDMSKYLASSGQPRGLFFLKVRSWDHRNNRPTGVEDRRLILVTDLGLVVKEHQDGARTVYVQSIRDGRPASGVRVEVVGKNGIPVGTATTDGSGRVRFPTLKDFTHEKTPTAILAKRGGDFSFIPYDWSDRRLNLSRYDIGGKVTGREPERLQAYLFSDRGIYRPGDEIRVGLIIKRPGWGRGLKGVPLETTVTDARGLIVRRSKIRLTAAGFEELRYATEENAPTGSYRFSVYIVKDGRRAGLLGSVSVKVEEFLPDRMKIATRFSDEREFGWARPLGLKGHVSLSNLFGTPAARRRIAAGITLSPSLPQFKGYPDFIFFDPNTGKKRYTERLDDKETDDEGNAEFSFELERFTGAVYRLDFRAEGFEAGGGRHVSSESSVLVSDLPYLLGYKPDGKLSYVSRHSVRKVRVAAVGPDLRKKAVAGLSRHLHEVRYVSALKRQANGTYKYESVKKRIFVSSGPFAVADAGTDVELPTGEPGDFTITVRGEDGGERLKIPFSVIGKANLTRSLEKTAELQVKLEKDDYAPGEEIELQIVAPYTGAGLITIERDKVYAHKWFRTTKTSTVERIRVPESLEGN
ncbi:MAG: MG2 domain-containing protein, partial [Elusimicrobiota bacterium]